MTKSITIIGNVASGKTTLARGLSQHLPAILLDCDPFDINPFLKNYAKDRARWALATELHFTLARYKQLAEEFHKNHHKPLIIDSGLSMGIGVYVKQHLHAGTMTKAEYALIRELTSNLIPQEYFYPDIAIVTRCPIRVCLERIQQRGREFERHYDTDYLSELGSSLNHLVADFQKRGIHVYEIDGKDQDFRDPSVINRIITTKLSDL